MQPHRISNKAIKPNLSYIIMLLGKPIHGIGKPSWIAIGIAAVQGCTRMVQIKKGHATMIGTHHPSGLLAILWMGKYISLLIIVI